MIGNVHTFSIAEGFANRAEVGYTRSVHQFGEDPLFEQPVALRGNEYFQRQSGGAERRPGRPVDTGAGGRGGGADGGQVS